MREGVDRKGKALFPMMPYKYFREMSDEDARSIVVYLRTLPPIRHAIAPREIDFPVNLLIKFAPKPVDGSRRDARSEGHAGLRQVPRHDRGLPRVPHPARRQGAARSTAWTSRAAGTMLGPWGRVVTANITPDPDNYMGQASRDEFIGALQVLRGAGRRERAGRAARARTRSWPGRATRA